MANCTKCGNEISPKSKNFMEVFYYPPTDEIFHFLFCYKCYWELADLLSEHKWYHSSGGKAK